MSLKFFSSLFTPAFSIYFRFSLRWIIYFLLKVNIKKKRLRLKRLYIKIIRPVSAWKLKCSTRNLFSSARLSSGNFSSNSSLSLNNHGTVLCNLLLDHTNYMSLGNYFFIVFMGKIIWFSTKFQNRRLFYFTSLELFAKLTMPYLLAEQIRANGKGLPFF